MTEKFICSVLINSKMVVPSLSCNFMLATVANMRNYCQLISQAVCARRIQENISSLHGEDLSLMLCTKLYVSEVIMFLIFELQDDIFVWAKRMWNRFSIGDLKTFHKFWWKWKSWHNRSYFNSSFIFCKARLVINYKCYKLSPLSCCPH